MSKVVIECSEPFVKSTLGFFNSNLSHLNAKRLSLVRAKGLAKYLAQSQSNLTDISLLDTTLGVLSFSVYMLRFSVNIGVLMEHIFSAAADKNKHEISKDLYFGLINDGLWATVNLLQFSWLSYKKSPAAGLLGMQIQTGAQLIDSLVIIIRYLQDKKEYQLTHDQASPNERVRIEWQTREIHALRAALAEFSMMGVMGVFCFSATAVPLSPILSAIILVNSVSQVLINIEKDHQLMTLQDNKTNSLRIREEKLGMINARLHELNQVTLNSIFLPAAIFLLLTTPIPITLLASLSMLLVNSVFAKLIDLKYSPLSVPLQETIIPAPIMNKA